MPELITIAEATHPELSPLGTVDYIAAKNPWWLFIAMLILILVFAWKVIVVLNQKNEVLTAELMNIAKANVETRTQIIEALSKNALAVNQQANAVNEYNELMKRLESRIERLSDIAPSVTHKALSFFVACALPILGTGCVKTKITTPTSTFETTRFLWQGGIPEAEVSTNGSMRLKGYTSEASSVAESVARGVTSGLNPVK